MLQQGSTVFRILRCLIKFLPHTCNVCGRNLITGLTFAASPRVDISSTCKVGQKLGVSLPLLTCSPSAWPFRLLYRTGRNSRRDLWLTLYVLLRAVDSPNLRYVSCTIWLSWENFELRWSVFLHPITYPSRPILSSCDHPLSRSVRTGRRQNYSALTWSPINELGGPSLGFAFELFNKCTGGKRTLFIYLINKYISLSDICLTVHHWYK